MSEAVQLDSVKKQEISALENVEIVRVKCWAFLVKREAEELRAKMIRMTGQQKL